MEEQHNGVRLCKNEQEFVAGHHPVIIEGVKPVKHLVQIKTLVPSESMGTLINWPHNRDGETFWISLKERKGESQLTSLPAAS